ncbi:organic cation transporter protein-like [Saccostrea echinata]|uniref:organic cation transporter protein-like n=1 Tax=Saccostrea echinata TaxID=191078 RepID=UPI002A81FDA9|nr:organic cation transporter protein-like [Saccostrea echinata]
MDVDNILRSLGKYGRYQVLQLVYNLFCMPLMTYSVVIYVFVGHIPEFKCKMSRENLTKNFNETHRSYNVTVHSRQCNVILETNRSGILTQESIPCQDGYEFFGQETTASEWNLVCGAESLGGMSTTMTVIGQMIGAALFSTLADKYGRLLISYTNFIALALCYVIAAVVPWFSAFVILRLLIGAFSEGALMTMGTLALEMFPAESRGFINYLDSIASTFSITSISLVAYLLRNESWRYTMLGAGIIGVHSLATRWILQESLRWLIVNGRYEEAKQWIKRASRWNKMDPSRILAKFDSEVQSREQTMLVDENTELTKSEVNGEHTRTVRFHSYRMKEKLSVLDIFRHKQMLRTSMILWVVWFVNSMTYYGLFLLSGTMSGNMYLNFFLNGIVEIPGIFLFWFFINRYGRRKTCVMFHAIAGVSLILAAVLNFVGDTPVLKGLASAMIFIGKSMITGSYTTIFIYTPEMYPTNLRALSIGMGSAAGRIGGMVSSFAALFGTYVPWGPGVVFGSLSLLVTILFQWLPETTGKQLPNTLQEAMSFSALKDNKKKDGSDCCRGKYLEYNERYI